MAGQRQPTSITNRGQGAATLAWANGAPRPDGHDSRSAILRFQEVIGRAGLDRAMDLLVCPTSNIVDVGQCGSDFMLESYVHQGFPDQERFTL